MDRRDKCKTSRFPLPRRSHEGCAWLAGLVDGSKAKRSRGLVVVVIVAVIVAVTAAAGRLRANVRREQPRRY